MPVGAREGHAGALVHGERGRDVEHREALDRLRVVHGEAVGDAPAAVVAREAETRVAQRGHRGHEVLRHLALRVRGVPFVRRRLARLPVAAQVRRDHGEAPCQPRRHLVPEGVGLRIAVQQQERRAGAADDGVHRDPPGIDVDRAKSGEKTRLLDHGAIMTRGIPPGRLMPINRRRRQTPKKGGSTP